MERKTKEPARLRAPDSGVASCSSSDDDDGEGSARRLRFEGVFESLSSSMELSEDELSLRENDGRANGELP